MNKGYTTTLLVCLSKYEASETHNGRRDGKKRVHGLWQESNGLKYHATEIIPDDVPLRFVKEGFVLHKGGAE